MSLVSLPSELVEEIMLSLGPEDLERTCRSSRVFSNLCSEDNQSFWMRKTRIDHPLIYPQIKNREEKVWKDEYKKLVNRIIIPVSFGLQIDFSAADYVEPEVDDYILSSEQISYALEKLRTHISNGPSSWVNRSDIVERTGVRFRKEGYVTSDYLYNRYDCLVHLPFRTDNLQRDEDGHLMIDLDEVEHMITRDIIEFLVDSNIIIFAYGQYDGDFNPDDVVIDKENPVIIESYEELRERIYQDYDEIDSYFYGRLTLTSWDNPIFFLDTISRK